jgi:hypothetical protein
VTEPRPGDELPDRPDLEPAPAKEPTEEPTPSDEPAPAEGAAPTEQPAPTEEPAPTEGADSASEPTPRPAVPSPAALARTLRRTGHGEPAEPEPADVELAAKAREWGRVDEGGAVYVRTADGDERSVGSWQAGQPDAALAFYARRYDALVVELDLLEQRIRSGSVSTEDATAAIRREEAALPTAQVVGDLAAIADRLTALRGLVDEQRQARRAERARVLEEARGKKSGLVEEAERVAAGNDWRGGLDVMRRLLDEWKALPRLERAVDDELWHRFSSARTAFSRRRKTHFAEQSERRDTAKARKLELAAEAEQLATSTEWGQTASRFRELMSEWKSAGAAWRADEESLWQRFRAAQETFFAARSATFEKRDSAEAEAAATKESLLREAQALLPIKDLAAAKSALRSIHDRWLAAGRVPRAAMARLESGLRAVEEAVRGAEQAEWQRTSPEALARAETAVRDLRRTIEKLEAQREKALAAGDERAAADATAALETRRSWLASAEETLADFRR